MKKLSYPTPEKIIQLNILSLTFIKVKKSDKAEVMSYSKINAIVNECISLDGDVYDKAVILLKGIIQQHPFASGNRRTAFIAAKMFIQNNNLKFNVTDAPENAETLQGIRERYYSDEELKEWIKNGTIRRFVR
jgi:death-on-curing family protein